MNILKKLEVLEAVVGITPTEEVTEREIVEAGYELIIEGVEAEANIARERAMIFATATKIAFTEGAEAAKALDTEDLLIEADTSEGTADEKKEKLHTKVWEWIKAQIAKIKTFVAKASLYLRNMVAKLFGKSKDLAKLIGDKKVMGEDFDAMLKAYNKIKGEMKTVIVNLTVVNLTKMSGPWAKIINKSGGEGFGAKLAGFSTTLAGLSGKKIAKAGDLYNALDADKEKEYTKGNIAEVARVKKALASDTKDSISDAMKKHMDKFEANVKSEIAKLEKSDKDKSEVIGNLRSGLASLSSATGSIITLERDMITKMTTAVTNFEAKLGGDAETTEEETPAE